MKKAILIILTISLILSNDGFYKDIFMDGGCDLYSHDFFYSADSLGLEWEFLATETQSLQDAVFITNEWDQNGILLYPDGEPRFRIIYTNGGSATNHGYSMGSDGRQAIRDFYYAGGSYTGSCAGAFISSLSYRETGTWTAYYHLWPGRTSSTGLMDTPTGHDIEPDSPLLAYFDFGGDMYIDNVYHTGGCYANVSIDWPSATEVLLRYDYPGRDMNDQPSSWAYKHNDESGRVVVIGSHPENYENGERMELMGAILQYAIAGQGNPNIKAALFPGEWRIMDRETSEDMPEYTKIGDKQYHHFTVDVPSDMPLLSIELDGEDGYHFNLYAKQGDFAFASTADFADYSENSDKTLHIDFPESGTWYIGVELFTTVETTREDWGYDYTANQEVLDGLQYSIIANLDSMTTVVEDNEINNADPIEIFPNPFYGRLKIRNLDRYQLPANIEIFDQNGRNIKTIDIANSDGSVVWNGEDRQGKPLPTGIYLIRIQSKETFITRRVALIRN
ncbi:MAG: FlgD immunoglobulin-like domain containing protein [Candidatus Zixiibacteriota bacterium]